jgi:hypothetical protein
VLDHGLSGALPPNPSPHLTKTGTRLG